MHDLIDLDPILYKINNNNVKLATLCRYFLLFVNYSNCHSICFIEGTDYRSLMAMDSH